MESGQRIFSSIVPTVAWEFNFRFQSLAGTTGNAFTKFIPPERFNKIKTSGLALIKEAFCAAILFYVIWWNIAGIPAANTKVPDGWRWIAGVLRLDQYWDMFAPFPSREDGWWVTPGKLADGTEVDVRHHAPHKVSWEAPRRISTDAPNDRWRSYYLMLWFKEYESFRPLYGD
jgi:hypothetical protein